MDEVAVAKINASVIDGRSANGEVEPISRLELRHIQGNGLPVLRLLAGPARQWNSAGGEAILDEPRAIQTVRGVAAPDVRHAQILERLPQHFRAQPFAASRYVERGGCG